MNDNPDLFFAEHSLGRDEPKQSRRLHWHGDPVQHARYLVKKLLPKSGVAILAGQSGAGKTFVALELAAALAIGDEFFGHAVPQRGGTLVLAAEGEGTIAERLTAAVQGRILPSLSLDDHSSNVNPARLPISWTGDFEVRSENDRAELIERINEIRETMHRDHEVELRLIVVDTLAAAFGFTDENSAAEATLAMKGLQEIAAETATLVVAIAHFGKSPETGVRGSSAFTASADAILAVKAERDGNGKVNERSLALTKSRTTDTGWAADFELVNVDLGEDEDGDLVASCWVRMTNETKRASDWNSSKRRYSQALRTLMEALEECLNEPTKFRPFHDGPVVNAVDIEKLRKEFYSRYPADGELEQQRKDAKRKQFSNGLAKALKQNLVAFREVNGSCMVWKL